MVVPTVHVEERGRTCSVICLLYMLKRGGGLAV